jgi:ATP adenylyltransferase
MDYIRSDKPEHCVFCGAITDAEHDRENLVLWRGEHGFVIMNHYPYTNGHLLVVPYTHECNVEDLEAEVLADLMGMVQRCVRLLRQVMGPDGFNIGINEGEIAGAGIAEHLHIHVVPRWQADHNFMAVLGRTKVIPDSLVNSYKELFNALEDL